MKNNRRIVLNVVYIILGIALIILSVLERIDTMWCGFGGGFVAVGILQLVKGIRYTTNEEYKEKIDTAIEDERNKYLRMKAWSWAGYLYVILSGCAAIVFMLMNQIEYMQILAFSLCAVVLLYWISYLVLSRKY